MSVNKKAIEPVTSVTGSFNFTLGLLVDGIILAIGFIIVLRLRVLRPRFLS